MKKEKNTIDSLMAEERRFPPPSAIQANAHVNSIEQYKQMYEKSLKDPNAFWLEQAKTLDWLKSRQKA